MQRRKIPLFPHPPSGGQLMVKTLLSIFIAVGLLAAAAVFEEIFVSKQFDKFGVALESLDMKVRNETASRSDAETVRTLWEEEKKVLHIVVPHRDIGYVDYWLGEAISLVETKNYDEALSKIDVLLSICEQIPQTYRITFENVF